MDIDKIFKKLSQFNPTLHNSYKKNTIHSVIVADTSTYELNPNILYICSCEKILHEILDLDCIGNLIYLYDYELTRQNFGKLNFISIEGRALLSPIFKMMSNLLNTYNDLKNKEMQLTNVLLTGNGLQYLVEKSKEIFRNPIMICDLANNILAYNKDAIVNNLSWSQLEENKLQTYEKLNHLHKSGAFERLYKSTEPVIEKFDYSPHKWMAYKITLRGKLAGHVALVEAENPYDKNDAALLKFFSKVIAVELEKHIYQDYIYENSYEYILADLLDGNAKEKEVIESQFKSLNQKLYKHFYLITIKKKPENAKGMQVKYIKNIIDNILNIPMSMIYNNDLIILLNHNREDFLTENYYDQLNHILSEYDLYAGVSHRFNDLSQLRKYFIQSIKAAELGQRLSQNVHIFHYKDYFFYHLFDSISCEQNLKDFCDPHILQLMEYDSIYSTEYSQTLYQYIANNMSVSLVSQLFDVHLNTIKYRLRKIEEILNISLKNMDTKLSFYITFKILHYLGKTI